MTKLFDPDTLNQATEVIILTGAKTIQLLAAGNLSAASPAAVNGVTGQCVYSFLKEEWKTDSALNKFKFPLFMFSKTDGQLQNGWTWADATTRELLRDFGYTEGANQFAGMVSLGDVHADADQAYYTQGALYNDTVTDFTYTGELNEAVDITAATAYIKAFLRLEGKTFAEYDLVSEQNLSLLEPVLYKFPFANAADINNVDNDTFIGANVPYTGMKINYLAGELFVIATATSYALDDVVQDGVGRWAFCTTAGTVATPAGAYASFGGTSAWEAYDGEYTLDGGTNYYVANRIVTGNNATAAQIYDYMQYEVRQVTDINANDSPTVGQRSGLVMNGTNAELLGFFVGSNLHTMGGVYVEGVNTNSVNDVTYQDITVDGGGLNAVTHIPLTSTDRISPFTAAGTLEFSANLVSETNADTRYVMYFDNAGGSLFDSSAAIIVQENDLATDIDGEVNTASISWDFNYDNNAQGGRTPATDAAVSIVATGLNDSQWVIATYTITRSTGQAIPVNANDERNYSNPV